MGTTVRVFQRRKDQPRRTSEQWRAYRRVGELKRLARRYYPDGIPHDEVGFKFAKYMMRTMAFDPIDERPEWLNINAPWLDTKDRNRLMSYGPYWYGDRSLGENLELHEVDRQELDIRTIEAFDVTPEQRAAFNREKDRQRQEKKRRGANVQTREQYLAMCKSRTKPWLLEGFACRRTWERHQKALREACRNSNPSPSLLESQTDELATSAKPNMKLAA